MKPLKQLKQLSAVAGLNLRLQLRTRRLRWF